MVCPAGLYPRCLYLLPEAGPSGHCCRFRETHTMQTENRIWGRPCSSSSSSSAPREMASQLSLPCQGLAPVATAPEPETAVFNAGHAARFHFFIFLVDSYSAQACFLFGKDLAPETVGGLQGSCLVKARNESRRHKTVTRSASLLSAGENRKERESLSGVRGMRNGLPPQAFRVRL